MTQDQLAAKCGVVGWDISRGTLSKIEAGLRCVTDAEVQFLSKALGVSINDLFTTRANGKGGGKL
jgi:transcriptional regulator with XRE-family HTH domain